MRRRRRDGRCVSRWDDRGRRASAEAAYGQVTSERATNFRQIEREKNIQPGTDEWFQLWFSKPLLTGEMPVGFRGRKK